MSKLKAIWENHNHSIITLFVMVFASTIGLEVEFGILVIGFWLGREHAQAEYRYMKLLKINRSKLGFFDGFKVEAWNYDSFIRDLLIPVVVVVCFVLSVQYLYLF